MDREHEWASPANTDTWLEDAEAGTLVWPMLLLPQHTTVPAMDKEHVCQNPADMDTWLEDAEAGTVL